MLVFLIHSFNLKKITKKSTRGWNTSSTANSTSTDDAQQFVHQPTTTQHYGPGMPPGGNNTTSSEFQDVEHQPGPWTVAMDVEPKDTARTTTKKTSAEETTVRGWLAEKGLEDLTNDDDLDFLEINDATQRATLQEMQTAASKKPVAVKAGPKAARSKPIICCDWCNKLFCENIWNCDECYKSSCNNCKGVGVCDGCNKQSLILQQSHMS